MWLLIPILLYSVAYLYVRHVYSYWRRKGFPHERSTLSWPFVKSGYKREFHYIEAINNLYQSGKERFMGFYCLFRPVLMVRDLSLARSMLENQSGHFNDVKWDYVRSYRKFNLLERLAPAFAAARLEAMFRNVEKVGDHMMNHLKIILASPAANGAAAAAAITERRSRSRCDDNNVSSDGCEVDMQNLLRIYAANIIANLIYGMDVDVFKQTDSVFRQYVNNSLHQSAVSSYTFNRIPRKSSLTYRLLDIIRKTVERREEGGTIRKDVLQVLVKFRNGNDIECRDKLSWHIENLFEREKVLSIKKMARITEHLLENSLGPMASTAVFTLYEILKQPSLIEKVRDELKSLKLNEKQQLNFENLKEMKLMDLCIQETIRKYPSVPVIERTCRKPYAIPNSKHILSEGKSFVVPLLAIQRDEKYFENPLEYKPQRFIQDSNGNQGENFIGFGLGAKACIAQNFVKLVVKYILGKLFLSYNMELIPCEDFDICYDDTPYILSNEGLKVKLKPAKIKFDL